MLPIAFSQSSYQFGSFSAIIQAVWTIVLPRTMAKAFSVACYWQHIRIEAAHPGWRRGCRSRQGGRNAMVSQPIHNAVLLIEVIGMLPPLKRCPGTDIHR